MRSRMGVAAVAGVVMVVAFLASAIGDEGPAELEAFERRLVAAIGTRELATYDRLVAEDYVATRPDGSELTKAMVMASYRSGERGYVGLEIEEVRARVHGDTGIVTARTRGRRIEDGREVENRVLYARVWARRGGRWQAVAQFSTPLP